jgi:hypothetical protein
MVARIRPRSGLLHCAAAAGVVLERLVSVSADDVLAMTILGGSEGVPSAEIVSSLR